MEETFEGSMPAFIAAFSKSKKLPRQEAEQLIRDHGGMAASSVSKKTDYLVCGEKAGSKLDKAQKLGVPVIDEAALLSMIG